MVVIVWSLHRRKGRYSGGTRDAFHKPGHFGFALSAMLSDNDYFHNLFRLIDLLLSRRHFEFSNTCRVYSKLRKGLLKRLFGKTVTS